MNTRKIQSGLAFFALAMFFMMAANVSAASQCFTCLYQSDTQVEFDPDQGVCIAFLTSEGDISEFVSTPFEAAYPWMDDTQPPATVNAFRYVGFDFCQTCTLTAYSNADYTGKSEVLRGDAGYGGLSFCAKSFKLDCENVSFAEEEEQEEQEEEEEEQEEDDEYY